MKRKNSNLSSHHAHGIRLSNSASAHAQVHRLPKPPVCNIQTKFIVLVSLYMIGSFVICLYHLTSLTIQMSEEELGRFEFHTEWHPKKRLERLPSVEERVKFYMSSWYLPPCDEENKLRYTVLSNETCNTARVVSSEGAVYDFYGVIRKNTPLYLDERVISDCARGGFRLFRDKLFRYKLSTEKLIEHRPLFRPICTELSELLSLRPSLAMIGNAGLPVPMFAPWREISSSAQQETIDQSSCASHVHNPSSPILWRLQSRRQHNLLARASRSDSKWENKKQKAIWRPIFSGVPGGDDFRMPESKEDCLQNPVCQFVFHHAHSELVNAGYQQRDLLSTSGVIDGVSMTKSQAGLRVLQNFKVLIHFEGRDDYGVGLAWKLYSRSVLLMHKPTRTTWLMEEMLQPWVHYVPLNATNAEDMMRWVLDNDEEAHKISERASMFLYDLLLHPDAMPDEDAIIKETMRRYQAHWQS